MHPTGGRPLSGPTRRKSGMRPWIGIQAPSWDGKIVLAAVFTVGYFFIIYMLVGPDRGDLSETQKDIATIALAALGPQLGQIYGSIFRTTAADERDSERRADALKTAIETPSIMTPGGASGLGDQVEDGAERGARAGVADGLAAGGDRTAEKVELPEYAR